MRRRFRLAVAAGALALAASAGCAKMTEEFNDAPVADKHDTPAEIHSMPDGFSNVATKCVGGVRVFTTKDEAGIAAVPDPTCLKEG